MEFDAGAKQTVVVGQVKAHLVKRTTRIFAVQPPRNNWQYGASEKSEIQNVILPGEEAGAVAPESGSKALDEVRI